MKGRAQKIRLGLFVMVSGLFLLILVGFFTARRLFEPKEHYYVAYHDVSVSGLQVGSPVKFLGIDVGSISDIRIDPDDVRTIHIRLSLREGTPVKEDAVADIVSIGITGLKTIEIRGGTPEADFLEEGGYIQAGTSLAEDITGQAEVIAYKVEDVLNNLLDFTHPDNMEKITIAVEKVSMLADNIDHTFSMVDEVMAENRTDLRETLEAVNRLSNRLDMTTEELYSASKQVNKIMQGEEISEVLGNIRDVSLQLRETNLHGLIESLAEATSQTQKLIMRLETDLEHGGGLLNENLELLQHTLENLNEASRKINSNPSVLIRGTRARATPDKDLQGN